MAEPMYAVPSKPLPVRDPLALVLQVVGMRWIPMETCRPADFVEFIGLTVRGPHDYEIGHYRFDGSGNEGIACTHWFPCPLLPKRAVEGFPPHEHDIGKQLTKSLDRWISINSRTKAGP